ncbi:NUMOD4 domain-containing protein [Clostridium sp. FP1]|uniref:NUMOD4 domain-containing protein n=1 Tax=Clostridium sp. FP1 TaxID=2724076 RepID=UPI0013E937E2|nr:NUMOD4 domain-containing protein [Clostridium sp. FP1]MBZ9633045.1 HNH endonuclease [Clostridium sp. FP1]
MPEVWKDIKGYEGLYQISNTGKVKSLNRLDNVGSHHQERILKPCLSNKGYLFVGIYRNCKRKPVYIHKLVAQYFTDNSYSKVQVNHLDGNKQNNLLNNLEWCSPSENIRHAHKNGLSNPVRGEQVGTSKLTKEEAAEIKAMKNKGISQKSIGGLFNISQQEVCKIHNNKCWVNI